MWARFTCRSPPDEHTWALYHFDEGQGDVLVDSSGNNHHGKIVGAKWVKADGSPITADNDFALQLEGVSQRVQLPDPRKVLSDPFTMECWARPKSAGYTHIFSGLGYQVKLWRNTEDVKFVPRWNLNWCGSQYPIAMNAS